MNDDRQRRSEFRDDMRRVADEARRFADDIRGYTGRYRDYRSHPHGHIFRPPPPVPKPKQCRSRMSHSPLSGAIVGAVIIAVGVIMLLDTLNIVHARDFWAYAPLGLTALGLVKLLDSRGRTSGLTVGAILSAVGIFWFLNNLGLVVFNPNLIWPLIIIFWGAILLLKTLENHAMPQAPPPENPIPPPPFANATPPPFTPPMPPRMPFTGGGDSFFNYFAFFGGGKRVISSPDFKGADFFALFGGGDIDLRGAEIGRNTVTGMAGVPPTAAMMMGPGQAVIHASTLYGGFTIRVPSHWWVEVQGIGIFGGYVDKTIHPPSDALANAPRLVVHGFAIFGGVTVTN
jgi:LiaF transmembrane domain